MLSQQEINQMIVDVLDQQQQELERIRAGKTLSNAMGIRQKIDILRDELIRTERPNPRRLDIG